MQNQQSRKGPKMLITDNTKRPGFKKRRNSIGSQSEVALKVRVSTDSLRSAENAFMNPSLYVAIKYCLCMDTTLEELFPDLFEQARTELNLINM
ncbi:XRE family transcriptional regulator [Paenibacillus psychroresistens]|uniref:XRE family transcriptional regulator n=1 Tax=Paenibacillus psychroresistens TaxID=1778678 RepID=A0A6B8RL44_9BACL|nr:helix-turn-helix transcriptional regulator [Paenibacillus psychroresistens]QGQ97030.1 XRE family transcriptional regulator [Paenibacillus psychroresistens]